MTAKEYLQHLLPKWKIIEKEPTFLRFERGKCAYTVDLGWNPRISHKKLNEIAGQVVAHYGNHLVDYQGEVELER